MNRREFIANTGLSLVAIYVAPSLLGCSGKSEINLQNLLSQPVDLLSSSSFISKEGNDDFGYFVFDKESLINSPHLGTKVFVFYKKSEIIGFTLIIEGINGINKLTKDISSVNGKYKLNYENDFGRNLNGLCQIKK